MKDLYVHSFDWHIDKTKGDINTLGIASDFQELLTRMEVELQNLQDALINQDLDRAMSVLATEQNVGSLMGMKMEHMLGLEAKPDLADAHVGDIVQLLNGAPVIECPYCWREFQTVANDEKVWVLPEHGHEVLGEEEHIPCPNSGKAPGEFLIKE